MTSITPPVPEGKPYRKEKWGYYGELGEGSNAKIRFLQTVIDHDELRDITLLSNIPGSEKWDVRDLFQRDVDGKRVEGEIMPYFKDDEKVKFFNPLTLIILPMADNGRDILKNTDYIERKDELSGGQQFEIYEKTGYYKFGIVKDNQAFAKIEWNDKKCFIVAIDGQHRLSALKRWKLEPSASEELVKWKIPVVILTIFKVNPEKTTANLLEIVRKTFIYINTQAVQVNEARRILLNDESINDICTQELIQYSHENDCKSIRSRDENIIPLLFFDWRGETKRGRRLQAPAAIKSIEEICSWFEYYLLGEDGSECQEIELNLTDLVPPLHYKYSDVNQSISHEDAKRIRHQFREIVLPGILYLLQNFIPYKNYIANCRDIEKEAVSRSDLAQHAFMKLRFGTHNAPDELIDAVHNEYLELIGKIEGLKNRMPEIINRDIGMRGIVCAFGTGKAEYEEIKSKSIDWIEYAKWVMPTINEIYEEGWFVSYDQLDIEKRKYLTHVIFDEAGSIINYRLDRIEDAFGALLLILIFNKMRENSEIEEEPFLTIWESYSDSLKKVIEQGFRKSYKAALKESFIGTQKDFNAEVREKAANAANKRLKNFAEFLGIDY